MLFSFRSSQIVIILTGGIIQHHCTNLRINHAVQLVGYYMNDGPVPYYIAKNQWGASWGDKGFVKIKYGGNVCGECENNCEVLQEIITS